MWYRHKIRTTTAVMESYIKGMENVLGYLGDKVRYDGSLPAYTPALWCIDTKYPML